MVLVEIIDLLGLTESAHFQPRNGETVAINSIDDLAGLGVTVWLDHGKGSSRRGFKLVLGENVSIVNQPELS